VAQDPNSIVSKSNVEATVNQERMMEGFKDVPEGKL
jgi:hypothetical protein